MKYKVVFKELFLWIVFTFVYLFVRTNIFMMYFVTSNSILILLIMNILLIIGIGGVKRKCNSVINEIKALFFIAFFYCMAIVYWDLGILGMLFPMGSIYNFFNELVINFNLLLGEIINIVLKKIFRNGDFWIYSNYSFFIPCILLMSILGANISTRIYLWKNRMQIKDRCIDLDEWWKQNKFNKKLRLIIMIWFIIFYSF